MVDNDFQATNPNSMQRDRRSSVWCATFVLLFSRACGCLAPRPRTMHHARWCAPLRCTALDVGSSREPARIDQKRPPSFARTSTHQAGGREGSPKEIKLLWRSKIGNDGCTLAIDSSASRRLSPTESQPDSWRPLRLEFGFGQWKCESSVLLESFFDFARRFLPSHNNSLAVHGRSLHGTRPPPRVPARHWARALMRACA